MEYTLENFPNRFLVLTFFWLLFLSGVDWKSLTIPASLPITTDYFPDPVSLVNEYVVNEYDLVPEEILSDAAADRSPLDAKNSLPTNEEIFTELISQRLAQGFQLILLTPQVIVVVLQLKNSFKIGNLLADLS